jgi:outer membrane protein
MNKGLLVLNIVLLGAVGVLFYLYFDKKDKGITNEVSQGKNDIGLSGGSLRVAYFDMDSIESNFTLFKSMQAEVNKKEDSINTILNSARMNLQSKYKKFQEQQATMTPQQQEQAGMELNQMDMAIKNNEASLNQSYQSYFMNKQKEVIALIKNYCKEYNKDKKYSYIIANEPGLFYFTDTACNITTDLLRGLNAYYSKQKKN